MSGHAKDLPTWRALDGAALLRRAFSSSSPLIVRAGESAPLASNSRGDLWHAARVTAITAAAIAVYRTLGFIVTMSLLLFALVFGAERRNLLYAGVFSVGVVLVTYVLFTVALKTPLDHGIFGF